MRPFHYVPSGGIGFECWKKEKRDHTESPREPIPNDPYNRLRHTVPEPITTSDVRKVTCKSCWFAIRRLAHRAIGKE